MKFSQRIGLTPAEKFLQDKSIDEDLKNSLWSLLTTFYWDTFNRKKYSDMGHRSDQISRSNLGPLFRLLWLNHFKKPIDTIPEKFYGDNDGLGLLRQYFFSAKWFEIYDFVEFVAANAPSENKNSFMLACNTYLERENSAYRFVDEKIVEISSPEEINEVESAISRSTPYYGVKQHLESAILLMSDRANPDYRNSIKESISAVEALCKILGNNDKATLGTALKTLENRGVMHPALKSAFTSLYGYTSDANGIRHALIEESKLTGADARFMLISCSAFINYIISQTTDK